ncbi:LOW QUALITY PROTEIN: hypothetical protein Ct61P_11776 [Colletotrichum tofieldiae]|nr:LOW QUALITY PROTEIN: hypothetical protein Ct61P_11776 [Colletotrichum tofieldiae]
MSCDVRPVITSTKTLYINPYEVPSTCTCAPYSRSQHYSTHSSNRCPRTAAAASTSPSTAPGSHSYSYPYSSPHPCKPASNPFKAPTRTPWRSLRTFDRNPDFRAVESSDFRFAVSELLDIGRILLHAESELDKARLRIERERAQHRSSHGAACERVLREWECSWTRRIGEMVVEADDLKLSSEVLADCWVKPVEEVRAAGTPEGRWDY